MGEIIYRVYREETLSSPYPTYTATLPGGQDLKSLKHRVNNDTLEKLATELAEGVFQFYYINQEESEKYGNVHFSFDLPYQLRAGRGGIKKPVHRLNPEDEEKFVTHYNERYRQKREEWFEQQVRRAGEEVA